MFSQIQVGQQRDCDLQPVESQHSEDNLSRMPNVGECIVALFTDGAFPLTCVGGDYLEADFYVKTKVSQMGKNSSLWKQPSIEQRENHRIHKNSVLPIRLVFGVNKFSTHRDVIYKLLNGGHP